MYVLRNRQWRYQLMLLEEAERPSCKTYRRVTEASHVRGGHIDTNQSTIWKPIEVEGLKDDAFHWLHSNRIDIIRTIGGSFGLLCDSGCLARQHPVAVGTAFPG